MTKVPNNLLLLNSTREVDPKEGLIKKIQFKINQESYENEFIFLMDSAQQLKIYFNLCPHDKIPLALQKPIVKKKSLFNSLPILECKNHYARFYIESGVCFDGVCKYKKLISLNYTILKDGKVYSQT